MYESVATNPFSHLLRISTEWSIYVISSMLRDHQHQLWKNGEKARTWKHADRYSTTLVQVYKINADAFKGILNNI